MWPPWGPYAHPEEGQGRPSAAGRHNLRLYPENVPVASGGRLRGLRRVGSQGRRVEVAVPH